jgi:hypothetical protein
MKNNCWSFPGTSRAIATLLALLGLACGAKVPSTYESNTNWLHSCTKDVHCAAGMICACGACSEACAGEGVAGKSQCPGDLVCQAESVCGGVERTACVARCETDSECIYLSSEATCNQGACRVEKGVSRVIAEQGRPSAVATSSAAATTSASPASSGGVPCSSPGHYERGKGSSVPDCCMGLTQVYFDSSAEVNGVRQCVQPAGHVNFACVVGICGDGVCEVGENVACGCAADCPNARVEVPVGQGSVPVPSSSSPVSMAAPGDDGCDYLGNRYPVGSTLPQACVSCKCEAGGKIVCGDVMCSQSGAVLPCSEVPGYDPAIRQNLGLTLEAVQILGQLFVVSYSNACNTKDVSLCYRDVTWSGDASMTLDLVWTGADEERCATPTSGEMRFYLGLTGSALTAARGTQSAAIALKTNYGVYELPLSNERVACGPCQVTPVSSTWCGEAEFPRQPVEWTCDGGSGWQDLVPALNASCSNVASNAARWCCAPTFSLSCGQ